jgi:hypothetical protein
MKKYFIMILIVFISALFFNGCNYSFHGASPPEGIKTIYIPPIKDESGFGMANLGENMTLLLKNKFIKDNTLEYAEKTTADGMITCTITSIRDEALVVTGTEQVSRRKITVTVNVDFQNLKKKKTIWNKDLSNWGEYESLSGGFSKRDEGVQLAIDKITDDILLAVISDW